MSASLERLQPQVIAEGKRQLDQALERTRRATGRPCDFTPEIASRILEAVSNGRTIMSVAAEEWSPSCSTIYLWAENIPEFSEALRRARTRQAHGFADQLANVHSEALASLQGDKSDSARVNAYRIKFEAMRWRAAMGAPEYSDKVQHQHTGNLGVSVSIAGLDREPIDVETVTESVTRDVTD